MNHTVKLAPIALVLILASVVASGGTWEVNERVVEDIKINGGEDIYESAQATTHGVNLTLAEPASEYGISKVYAYNDSEPLRKKNIEPHQRTFEIGHLAHYDSFQVVAYDGSNRVVSDVTIRWGERTRKVSVLP